MLLIAWQNHGSTRDKVCEHSSKWDQSLRLFFSITFSLIKWLWTDELDLIWDVVLPSVYDEAGGLGSPKACKEKDVSKEIMTGMYFKLGKEVRI